MRSQAVKEMINKYGSDVKIVISGQNAREEHIKAFVQPLKYLSKMENTNEYLKLGLADKNVYLYIGPPEIRIDTYPFDTVVQTNNDSYVIQNSEKVCFKNEIIYIWSVLKKFEEDYQLNNN